MERANIPIVILLVHETYPVQLALSPSAAIVSSSSARPERSRGSTNWTVVRPSHVHAPRHNPTNASEEKARISPSKGEKPPFIISSRSQSCLSESNRAGSFSASASSSFLRGASRETRSFRIPPMVMSDSTFLYFRSTRAFSAALNRHIPWGGLAIIREFLSKTQSKRSPKQKVTGSETKACESITGCFEDSRRRVRSENERSGFVLF